MEKYDVFISFRGEDTCRNFTSHLHDALLRHGIETFIDDRLDKGDEVWPTLVKAIHDSSNSLIIFSENYATSTWCLNELVEIMECKEKKKGHDVIPVFYDINPSHVRKQIGSYKTTFDKHEQDFKHKNKEMLQKWKDALTKAANISGFDSDSHVYRTESDMIKGIIKLILRKLNRKHSYELRDHFIPNENYAAVKSLLSNESTEVRIIGLWGMGGIGKTTVAAAILQQMSYLYEGTCFLANVREQSKHQGLGYICSRLFSELLGEDICVDTPTVISSITMSRLRRKKVLVVLDDVNSLEVIKSLVGVRHNWLGAGSRVIVTTRDKQVLVSARVDIIHEVKKMNIPNSLQLFCLNAFHNTHPEEGYEELSNKALAFAKGIPLALTVLGSFLCRKSEKEWKSALQKLEKYPNSEIQGVLRLSYDELDDTEERIFLDIACFFKGQAREPVTRGVILRCIIYVACIQCM